jgi:predicted TIM-barrel fold metal-dependent hydrolase
MKTTWGDVDVIDAHAHFFSHSFFASLAKALDSPPQAGELYAVLGKKLPFDFPPEDDAALARRWVEELDRHAIARTVLIASVPGDEDSVATAASAYPERFIPYFMLNPKAQDALDRTKRAFRELRMKGLCLFPAMHHFHLWERNLEPILDVVAEEGGIVFVHCGLLKVGVRDKLGLSSPFDIRFANPLHLSGVARRLAGVPFVVPHFGCGFLRELLLVASECQNVYTDSSSSNSWISKLPQPMTLAEVFGRAIEVMGSERVLYGSDSSFFPRGFQKDQLRQQLAVLEELGVASEQARQILGGNLARIVG